MVNKGDAGFVVTAAVAVVGFFSDYSAAIFAICTIITALSTVWFHWAQIQQKKRDRALEHKRLEIEQERYDEQHNLDQRDSTE